MVIKNMWPIIMLLLSALIGYQFSRRSKGNDLFLESLTKSYENVYFPMYIRLKKIKEQNDEQKLELLEEFFKGYYSYESTIKLIAPVSLLERFFDIYLKYLVFTRQRDESSKENLWKNFEDFYVSIENEFWEAHEIIYKDYFISKALIKKNPFLGIIMELSILLFNITTFLLYLTGSILYFSIWNYFQSLSIFPVWWTLKDAILLFLCTLVIQSFMLIISSWYVAMRNKRTNGLLSKKLEKRAKKIWQGIIRLIRRHR
ncbi:hypothetical protein [Desulfosporosinus sp. BG]|uniref:hypothetical protein n=1 Tax=Desulfosporosinus sp. BG TaxID=1633135 RepID=UPI00083A6FB0|nr:hypothetical protein [Desulfosporosinus sp. BG]ODA41816.1 hypothetical protein DSBG_1308 [Desulfosporosinus sp. BG]